MTAKDKAKRLVQVYFNEVSDANPLGDILVSAKLCALICVDEMIEFAYDVEWEKREEAVSKLKFLKEVKQEINKL